MLDSNLEVLSRQIEDNTHTQVDNKDQIEDLRDEIKRLNYKLNNVHQEEYKQRTEIEKDHETQVENLRSQIREIKEDLATAKTAGTHLKT